MAWLLNDLWNDGFVDSDHEKRCLLQGSPYASVLQSYARMSQDEDEQKIPRYD